MNVETDEVQGSGKNVGKSVMEVPRLNTKKYVTGNITIYKKHSISYLLKVKKQGKKVLSIIRVNHF